MIKTNNTYRATQHDYNQLIVFLIVLFLSITTFAQIGITKDTVSSDSHFFSNELIFVGENTVLSIQTKNITLNEDITGLGLLHIGNTKQIALKTITPITIKKIQIENTTVSLQSELVVTGKIHLKDAAIKLNNYNLITKDTIFFKGESTLIENGLGIWIQKDGFKQKIAGHSSKNNQVITTVAIIEINTTIAKKHNTKQFFLNKIELNRIYSNIPKPPPKLV